MANAELHSVSSVTSFPSLDLSTVLSRTQESMGTFEGQVQLCENLDNDDWKSYMLEITEEGSLIVHLDATALKYSTHTVETTTLDGGKNKIVIKHLQSCTLQLLEHKDKSLPIIKVGTALGFQHLQLHDVASFEPLLCCLLWWSGLKSEGIFNKVALEAPDLSHEVNDPTNVLVSQLFVFGPIPKSRNIPLLKHISKPSFLREADAGEGWFPAMGVLKSNGVLDLLLQSDGSLLYSLDITILMRSEIRKIDPSLDGGNFLYMGILPELRTQLNMSVNCKFLLNCRNVKGNSGIIFKFPLMIDVEDWVIALNSFALAENLSLIGSHKSNRLRVSNRFKVTVIEGDFSEFDWTLYDPSLYLDLSIWGNIWARTPIVSGTAKPFWREEFFFNESTKIDNLRIEVKQRNKQKGKKDETIGLIELPQECVNDGSLSKETRLPVIGAANRKTKIGTICIKIISSLNFVLPAVNFNAFESILSEGSFATLTNYVYDTSLAFNFKFEDFSTVLLDIFQAIGKEPVWFAALIDKELTDVDGSITRNTINNKTSTHIYSTLFRGNSPLTKSVEMYFYRVGKEYLDRSIGDILRQIIKIGKPCEVDPSRVKESEPEEKEAILEENRGRLLEYVRIIWETIYHTTNDLPTPMKVILKTFRSKLEIICIDEDCSTVLNCVSGILFLRFFCPVILNPKLFNFVGSHLDETSRRTLTLISKVLLNLSNLTAFGKKEPYMIALNTFIEAHRQEVLDYVDRVTEKKLDFSPKTLKLTSSVARPKLVMNKDVLMELPATPYLIDRYLRETELFTALATIAISRDGDPKILQSASIEQMTKNMATLDVSPQKKTTDIGELEFEKVTNNTEVFGDDLMKYLKRDKSSTPEVDICPVRDSERTSDRTRELEQESILLFHRSEHLKQVFSDYEIPAEGINETIDFAQFLAQHAYYSKDKMVFVDKTMTLCQNEGINRLFDISTGRSALLESIVPNRDSGSVERSSFVSSWSGPPLKSRAFSRLKSTRLDRKQTGSSENVSKDDTRKGIKKWFRRIK